METHMQKAHKRKGQAFADYVIGRLSKDRAFGATLRKADNPATEYQAWEHLIGWCNIEKPWERLPFTVVASALARAQPAKDGHLGLGRGIAKCYEDGHNSDAAKAKLRRVLACNTTDEVCRILRQILRLIQSRGVPLCYGGLLDELLWFSERQKLRWAAEFYGKEGKQNVRNDA